MLVKKDGCIEVWSNGKRWGIAVPCLLFGSIGVLAVIAMLINANISAAIKFMVFLVLPGLGIGIYAARPNKRRMRIEAKVDANYIEIYRKYLNFREQENKKIAISQIEKIVISGDGIKGNSDNAIEIRYIENGENKKISFPISFENTKLIGLAIKEYKKDIEIKRWTPLGLKDVKIRGGIADEFVI